MYKELYRPQYHFTPSSGWMNDPNGLVFFKGEYHLFYQHNPYSLNWDSMHWGHAISKDLVHWKHLPVAYKPETEIDDYFSGSSVVDSRNVSGLFPTDEGGMVNIFTHRDNGIQQQSIGYSADGRHFTRYLECVLLNPGREDFRDPKVVWMESKKRYIMALAVYDHVEFYTSKDLKKWTFYSQFGQIEGTHLGVWECPDLFELPVRGTDEKRWVLVVSDQGTSKTQYFVGRFEGSNFVSDDPVGTHLFLDGGTDCYATQTYSNMPDGRRVMMAWQCSPHLMNCTPTSPWRSAMTVPRVLWLEQTPEGLRLFQQPVDELNQLRQEPVSIGVQRIDRTLTVLEHTPPQYDIELELDVSQSSAVQAGVQICSGEKQEIVVGYDLQRHMLYVNRSLSGNMNYASAIVPYHETRLLPQDGKIGLRILLDHSTLEVFDMRGRAVITAIVFPDVKQDAVKLFARKGSAQFGQTKIYPMRSIWDE